METLSGLIFSLIIVVLCYLVASREFQRSSLFFERVVNTTPFIHYAFRGGKVDGFFFATKLRLVATLLIAGLAVAGAFQCRFWMEYLIVLRLLRCLFLPYLGLLPFKASSQRPEMCLAVAILAPVLVVLQINNNIPRGSAQGSAHDKIRK